MRPDEEVDGWLADIGRSLLLLVILFAVTAVGSCMLSSCAAIGAAIGGTVGSLAGPAGTVGGAVAGAEAGDIVAGKKCAEAETKKRDADLAVVRAQVVELQATIKANGAIDAHNAHLAPGETPTHHLQPVDADESHRVFWIALALVLAALGGAAAYIFRRPLRTWLAKQWRRIEDFVGGRAPSYSQPPATPPPPPERTPMNPNP